MSPRETQTTPEPEPEPEPPRMSPSERAAEVFQKVDTDGDGLISGDELREAVEEHYCSCEQSTRGQATSNTMGPTALVLGPAELPDAAIASCKHPRHQSCTGMAGVMPCEAGVLHCRHAHERLFDDG